MMEGGVVMRVLMEAGVICIHQYVITSVDVIILSHPVKFVQKTSISLSYQFLYLKCLVIFDIVVCKKTSVIKSVIDISTIVIYFSIQHDIMKKQSV